MIKRNDGISKDDICQNQFTAYVVLAVKRKRQSYIKKKQREHEKETRTKKEAEQSEFRTAGYDMWSRMEPQNEKLMAAMQQLSLKERFVVTEYVLKGKPFKEIAQETGLKEKGVASKSFGCAFCKASTLMWKEESLSAAICATRSLLLTSPER